MLLFWFYFSGCIKQDYKNKYFVTGDWSQSTACVVDPDQILFATVHFGRWVKNMAIENGHYDLFHSDLNVPI